MILIKLFLVFSYIGVFNFGGGYAMLSFIQQEVVEKRQWLSEEEFTDIVAISQVTPGPIGINCATYVGYTAVCNDPWVQSLSANDEAVIEPSPLKRYLPHLLGILGSVLATMSIVWLPFIVMIMVSKLILKHHDSVVTKSIFRVLRPAIIGLLASAALSLMNFNNFGSPNENLTQFIISLIIFLTVFIGIRRYKWNIIYTTFSCAMIGIIIYGFIGI